MFGAASKLRQVHLTSHDDVVGCASALLALC